MELGLFIFPTEYTIQPGRLARLAEERGFTRLFFPEHTHIPAARDTPYPAGGELPREYSHTYDPFVALAMAAAATERIKVGTDETGPDERALLVPLVVDGVVVDRWTGPKGTALAREHHAAAIAELPHEAFRLGRGEAVLPTVYA